MGKKSKDPKDDPMYIVRLLQEAEESGSEYYAKPRENNTLIGIDHPTEGFIVRAAISPSRTKLKLKEFNDARLFGQSG